MRLPNSYGSVYKLSGNRRNPWAVRKTIGWKEGKNKTMHPEYKFIGFYPTKTEALQALAQYNNDPIALTDITLSELYDLWSTEYSKSASNSAISSSKNVYRVCKPLYNKKVRDIRLPQLQSVFDTSGKNTPMLKRLKTTLSLMYKYGVKNELVSSSQYEMIKLLDANKAGNPNAITRSPFSDKEIEVLWEHKDNDICSIALMLIYSGLRIGELLDLKRENVHLDEQYIYIESAKTKAGVRDVPIASKIAPIIEFWFNKGKQYLVTSKRGLKLQYSNLSPIWHSTLSGLGLKHSPHDTRHTCISLLAKAGVEERLIRQIVGHKGNGITQAVYLHIDLPQKIEAINKI